MTAAKQTNPILLFEPENNPFQVIYVDITHRCQMACANCYLPNRSIPDMNVDKLYPLLNVLPRKTDIRLIGGEPTLREDLPTIIKHIAEAGHRPMLITNALRLSDLEYCRTLKDAGLEYAQISLNGFNDDKIYQIIDQMACAQKKMAAVKNCDAVGIGVSISSIIIKNLNPHIVGEIIEYSKSLKLPVRINFRNVGDLGRSMAGKIDNLSFDDLITLVSRHIGVSAEEMKQHMTSDNQLRYPFKLGTKRSDTIWIKLTDWNNYPLGVVDVDFIKDKNIKGRVTEDFKLAPFFEHVKLNEFGY